MQPITEEAFSDHYLKGKTGTLRFLLGKGVSPELAEDITQAAWARAWEKREQWNGTSRFSTWVHVIAWNCFLTEKRKCPVEQFPERFDSPIAPVDRHTEMDVERALAICSADERKLLTTRYLKDLSNDEAATVMAMNTSTLKTRVFRLTQRLRATLSARPKRRPQIQYLRPLTTVRQKRRSPQWRRMGIRHTAECEWCGTVFEYRSTLLLNGEPRYPRRVCSRACIPSMAHEGRRKLPMSEKRLRDLYEVEKLSTTQIAKLFGCATHKTVCRALAKHGIQLRAQGRTSDGKCKECGAPVVRKKNGAAMSRLCHKHQTAYQTEWARRRRAKDPSVGCRPLGRKRKPRACPRCGVECIGTREANAHCPSELRQERARLGWITRKRRAIPAV